MCPLMFCSPDSGACGTTQIKNSNVSQGTKIVHDQRLRSSTSPTYPSNTLHAGSDLQCVCSDILLCAFATSTPLKARVIAEEALRIQQSESNCMCLDDYELVGGSSNVPFNILQLKL